jgi:hypothetical protein
MSFWFHAYYDYLYEVPCPSDDCHITFAFAISALIPFDSNPDILFRSEATLSPQLGTVEVQPEYAENAAASQAGQKRDTTVDTQVDEQRAREMDGTSCKS